MSLKQQITRRYHDFTLKRIQRQVTRYRKKHPNTKESSLRIWMLSAEHVDKRRRQLLITAPLLLLLPVVLWVTLPLMGLSLSSTAEVSSPKSVQVESTTSTPAAPSKEPATVKVVQTIYSVQLQLNPQQPETEQILEKIRQRPLPIKIQPQQNGHVLLIDETPGSREDAKKLQQLYHQLFGVEGQIIERIIETGKSESI